MVVKIQASDSGSISISLDFIRHKLTIGGCVIKVERGVCYCVGGYDIEANY